MALCQFWKAKVVRHIAQKFVVKKCGEKKSSIRRAPMTDSGSASSRAISTRSAVVKPNWEASRMWPSASISRALAWVSRRALNSSVSCRTDTASSPSVGIVSSRFQRQT